MAQSPEQKITKGTRIRVGERRVAPLGPIAGTLLIDFPDQIAELHAQTAEHLASQGIDVSPLPEFDRGEWLGAFEFEVEVVVEVVGFHATADRTEEEAQQASLAHVLWGLLVLAVVVFGYLTVDRWTDGVEAITGASKEAFPLIAVALGFLAIALLAREIRKTKALAHGTL